MIIAGSILVFWGGYLEAVGLWKVPVSWPIVAAGIVAAYAGFMMIQHGWNVSRRGTRGRK